MDLRNAILARTLGDDTLADALNQYFPALKGRYNSEVAKKLLSRLPTEELPTEPRAASSFRSRVSLLLEYAVIDLLADFLNQDLEHVNVTYNTLNEFADFFIRDEQWDIQLRIDIKTLHDLSLEASARYDTLQAEIREYDDYLLFIAWSWQEIDHLGVRVVIPAILDGIFIPAREVARERDLRQELAEGSFDSITGQAMAKGGKKDTNFGKMGRLVHNSRRDAPDLSPRLKSVLSLMAAQDAAKASEPTELKAVEELADVADASSDVTARTDEE